MYKAEPMECSECSGTGLIRIERFFSHNEGIQPFALCPKCNNEELSSDQKEVIDDKKKDSGVGCMDSEKGDEKAKQPCDYKQNDKEPHC